ncbi:MAG: FKBP-type peptidyl-prolyl cis-trans isomerase [Candidatus Bathyarchaeia archaeon]|jgi:FKBP-type peptidyl-prolyl cis-trans isomerase SlyD
MSEEKKPIEEKPEEKPVEEPKVKTPVVEAISSEKPVEETKTEAPVVEAISDVKPIEESKAEAPIAEAIPGEKPAEETKTGATVEAKEEKPPEEPRIEGAVNKGDFILMEMTGRAEETGEVFDTTNEEVAKEKGTHREGNVYGPRLVVVGEGWVLRGLDARLRGVKPNEQTSIEIPAAEAFGERDPVNVQLIPYRILRSKGVNPVPGAELEIDGRQAVIRSVGAGRVQVDYNHALAGRKIIYDVKVTEIISEEKAKVTALIGRRFVGVNAEKFGQKMGKKKMTIIIPDEIFFGENIQIAKRGLAMDVLKFFPELEDVEFQEIVKRS